MGFISEFSAGWKKQQQKERQRQKVVKAQILKISRGSSFGGPIVAASVVVDEEAAARPSEVSLTIDENSRPSKGPPSAPSFEVIEMGEPAPPKLDRHLSQSPEILVRETMKKLDAETRNKLLKMRPRWFKLTWAQRRDRIVDLGFELNIPEAIELRTSIRSASAGALQAGGASTLGADAESSSEEDEPSSTQNPIHPSLGAEQLVRETMPGLSEEERTRVLEGVDWGKMSWDERRDRILEVGISMGDAYDEEGQTKALQEKVTQIKKFAADNQDEVSDASVQWREERLNRAYAPDPYSLEPIAPVEPGEELARPSEVSISIDENGQSLKVHTRDGSTHRWGTNIGSDYIAGVKD